MLEVCSADIKSLSLLLRSTILLDSKSVLRSRAVSDQAIAEALVSSMLLEDSSPRQALADFLLARTASIQQLLKQPQHGTHTHTQYCLLLVILRATECCPWIILDAEHTPHEYLLASG